MATVAARGIGSRPYGGIDLIAVPPYGLDLFDDIWAALDLIQQTDPRRFHRIQQFVTRIILIRLRRSLIMGQYNPIGKVCGLARIEFPTKLRYLARYSYASTIIHEATHGYLFQRKFPASKSNRRRIEVICVKEEARFMSKFPQIRKQLRQFEDGLCLLARENDRCAPRHPH